jgi:hypothetical protein
LRRRDFQQSGEYRQITYFRLRQFERTGHKLKTICHQVKLAHGE